MRGKTTEKLETEENVKEVKPPKISKKKKNQQRMSMNQRRLKKQRLMMFSPHF